MLDLLIKRPSMAFLIARKAKNTIFTFLTNQSVAMQAIDLRAHPWAL